MTVADEMRKLQGTWKQIGFERDGGTKPPAEEGFEPRTVFVGDTFTVIAGDGNVLIKGTFKLDLERNPKAVDWTDTFGENAGETFPAIYILEGDRFVFCAGEAGQERPRSFQPRDKQVLRVHQRIGPT